MTSVPSRSASPTSSSPSDITATSKPVRPSLRSHHCNPPGCKIAPGSPRARESPTRSSTAARSRSRSNGRIRTSGEGEHVDRVGFALYVRRAKGSERYAVIAETGRGVAREDRVDPEFLGERLHPRGGVDRVTDRVVLGPLGQADRADDHVAGVQAHAELHDDLAARGSLNVEVTDAPPHRERGARRGESAVRGIVHRAEDGHDSVSGELVEDAAV